MAKVNKETKSALLWLIVIVALFLVLYLVQNFGQFRINKSLSYQKLGDEEKDVNKKLLQYKKALLLAPNDSELVAKVERIYFKAQSCEKILLLRQKDNLTKAFLEVGKCYVYKNDVSKAQEYFKKVEGNGSANTEVNFWQSIILASESKKVKNFKSFDNQSKEFLEILNQNEPTRIIQLAAFFNKLELPHLALKILNLKKVEVRDYYIVLSQTQELLENDVESKNVLERAKSLDPVFFID